MHHSNGYQYHGPLVPYYFLTIYNVMLTVRSLIHMFRADGGAQSIAGLELTNNQQSQNLVAIFAQWGASQFMLSVIIWLMLLLHAELTPLMLGCCVLELILRRSVGLYKKYQSTHTPPGAIGTRILFPIVIGMCLWSYLG